MKILSITVTCAVSGFLLFVFVVAPYRCNCAKESVERSIINAITSSRDEYSAVIAARRALEVIERACGSNPSDLDANMDAAAALQLLSRYDLAEQRYLAAMRLERRPEIYLQLGNTQIALGHRKEGEENLYRCGLFNPQMLDGINDPLARRRVYDRVVAAHAAMQRCARIDERVLRMRLTEQYRSFGERIFAARMLNCLKDSGFLPASVAPVTVVGTTVDAPSAAEFWRVRNDGPGTTTTTSLIAYGNGGSSRMLHVSSDGVGGVVRRWGMPGTGPRRVLTATWVFLVYGEVMVGSGNGDRTEFDNRTTEAGTWRLILGISHSAPANETVIFAGPGGAEFYVASAAVFPFDESALPH